MGAWLLWILAVSGESHGETLTVLAPDLPGTSEAGGVGRDAETVKRVLQLCGYETTFILQPFGRHILTYTKSAVAAAVMTVPLPRQLEGASTAAYIWYQNGAIYDSAITPHIASVEDLYGLKVVTFKDGVELLDISDIESRLGDLLEISDQRVHSRLLMLRRVDSILADGLIVAKVNQGIREQEGNSRLFLDESQLRFAPIFTPSPFKMVFRDPLLAKAFDGCFDEAYKQGIIGDINEKYISPYQHELGFRYLGF
ncbi:transporter substrate-binding domain-containing protein [Marinobacter caseinilyticus]|uniref:transporter substrate-binding domain-containing protein n=1 Tax=Marinobacter caseinilyticus TaxID=2692195 RepID=UPI00140CC367|nr:transporter substrate-binding domain-containing protein [Marinobacter caseinilyticus]